MFGGNANYNYFHSYAFKEMGYDTYSFFLNGPAMLFITLMALGFSGLIVVLGRMLDSVATKYESEKLKKVAKRMRNTGARMPHAIARLSFLQLTFTSALDFNYITYEKATMDTAAFASMVVILLFGIYALGEIVLALVYRNYIIRNEFDKNVP